MPCQSGDYVECYEYPWAGFEYTDCDGGCNNAYWGPGTPTYEYISSSQAVCGVGFTYTDQGTPYRDTDWYEFIVVQQCTLRVTGTAEFPFQMGFLNAGCPNNGFLAVGTGAPCGQLVVSTPGIVYPGNYVCTFSVATGAQVWPRFPVGTRVEESAARFAASSPAGSRLPTCAGTRET